MTVAGVAGIVVSLCILTACTHAAPPADDATASLLGIPWDSIPLETTPPTSIPPYYHHAHGECRSLDYAWRDGDCKEEI